MNPRAYPKTKKAAVKLAVDTIRRGVPPDRAVDSCFEMGEAWNQFVLAGVYRCALDDDMVMRNLLRYLDVERAREAFDRLFPLGAVGIA